MKAHSEGGFWTRTTGSLMLVLAIGLVSGNAYAYLDPGSGSMLLQVILGGVAAIGVAMKLYWHRIKAKLGFGGGAVPEDDTEAADSET